MRINLLTINILSYVLIIGTLNNKAVAQANQESAIIKIQQKDTTALYGKDFKKLQNNNTAYKSQLISSYALIPGGNYTYYNPTNGHTSDARAGGHVDHIVSALTPDARDASSLHTRTAASLLQEAPDGNSGLHLQLTNDNGIYAQTGFYFILGASDKYFQIEDAVQLDGPGPMVFLSSYSSDGVNLCINTMSDYAYGKRMRLFVNGATSGQYVLSMADFNEIDTAEYNLYLVDNQQRDSIDLVHKTYTFNIESGDTTSFGAYRFYLSIQHKPVAGYSLSNFSGQKVSTGVQLNWTAVNAGNYTGYTVQKINAGDSADSLYFVQSDNGVSDYNFTDMHPIIGNNVYRLEQNGIKGAITYSSSVTVCYSNSSATNYGLLLYPNPAKGIMNANLTLNSIAAFTYAAYIYDEMGKLVKQEAVTQATWTEDLSSYKAGIYFIQVKDNNGSIIAKSKFMKSE